MEVGVKALRKTIKEKESLTSISPDSQNKISPKDYYLSQIKISWLCSHCVHDEKETITQKMPLSSQWEQSQPS